MILYIFFFMLIFILSFKIEKGKYKVYDFIFIGIIIIFSAIRSVGTDYYLYKNLYNMISELSSVTSRTGIGFNYIMILFHNVFHFDYQVLIFLVSFLTNSFVYYFIKKNSNNPGRVMLLYICLGFYTTSFNMFRQMFSISMILLGSHYFYNKNIIKTILLYLFAILVHSSSIIGILGFIIINLFKKKHINPIIVFSISCILLMFYDKFFPNILNLFNEYKMYLNYDSKPGIGTIIIVSIYILMYLVLYANRKELIKKNNINLLFLNLTTIGVGLMILEFKNFLFFRIAYYFIIYIVFLLSDYYNLKEFNKNRIISLLFYFCIFIYFIIYISSFDGVLPYRVFI